MYVLCTFGTFLFDLASNSYTASHIVDFVKIEIEFLPGFEKLFKPNLADFAYGLKVLFHLFVWIYSALYTWTYAFLLYQTSYPGLHLNKYVKGQMVLLEISQY